jgi:hypothetical protein
MEVINDDAPPDETGDHDDKDARQATAQGVSFGRNENCVILAKAQSLSSAEDVDLVCACLHPARKLMNTQHPAYRLPPLHALLAMQSLVIVLGSINRLGSFTLGYVAPNEFLRWVDLLNMIPIPLMSVLASYLLLRHLDQGEGRTRPHLALGVAFVLGVYLLAASYGDHEVTNYLHTRFCAQDESSDLCRIIIYNDDEFSHYLFFAGFVIINTVVLLYQVVFPYKGSMTGRDRVLIVANALFIALGIFANLAFEVIGLDLYVVALLTIFALYLLWRRGSGQPLILYYALAYSIGLAATAVVKVLGLV